VPPPLIVIGGPTATGKSGLAVSLAVELSESGHRAEIIGADSRQVYRGMDVGTAKVPLEERGGIPHHGIDLVDPDDQFSVADFARHASAILADISSDESGVAVLVGGTGLYLRAVTRDLDAEALPADRETRAAVERDLAALGLVAMAKRLRSIAPRLAARVDLQNPRRVARALEIATLAGDIELPGPGTYPGRMLWLGLALDAATNRAWIERRARAQFRAGLLEEAAGLRTRYDPGLRSFSAFGYREAFAVLDDTKTIEEAIAEDARRTTAFARRQRTWFRSEADITWLDAAHDPLQAARDQVRAFAETPPRAGARA
jgi:tRNA dimethylallyltransferase